MFKLASLALLALPAAVSAVNIPYTNCGTSTDHITISTATASVWPPVPGQALDIVLAGATDEDITGGTYEAKVTFDFIPVLDKSGNIAELVKLPVSKGAATITKSVTLPASIPSGAVTIHVTASDQASQELVCIDISAQIGAELPKIMVHNFGFEAFATVDVPFTNCGSASDILNITSLTASVWPPVAGQALSIAGSGILAKDVVSGSFDAKVSYSGIPLIDKSGDLSTVTTLPMKAGSSSISKSVVLPSTLPGGAYAITASATDGTGASIGCVQIAFTL